MDAAPLDLSQFLDRVPSAKDIRARLDELAREQETLRTLLRIAMRREKSNTTKLRHAGQPGQEVSHAG